MNRISQWMVKLALILVFSCPAYAGEVKLHVDITGGSFDAKSAQLRGTAKKVGEQYLADQIIVPINTLDSGNSLRNSHMQNKYMEAGKFPNAVLSKVKAQDGKFTGLLSVHGVTKPVSGEYEVKGNAVVATFKTQITGHGMSTPNYMGIGVEDDVEITATIPYEVSGTRLPPAK